MRRAPDGPEYTAPCTRFIDMQPIAPPRPRPPRLVPPGPPIVDFPDSVAVTPRRNPMLAATADKPLLTSIDVASLHQEEKSRS